MANIIGYPEREELPELELDDRKLHILCSVLALSTTALAATPSQRDLSFFFCSRDLRVLGAGMGGFDLGELPWGPDLEADRRFLDSACNATLRGQGWERLSYHPDPQWLLPAIMFLRQVISLFQAEHQAEPDPVVRDLRPQEEGRCAHHGVYLHRFGCLLC